MTHDLRFPIGELDRQSPITPERRALAIKSIEELPAHLRAAVGGLDDAQLDTPYRPGGWTVRQLVHHVADSHMNGYIRLKLALTENNPAIKPYEQDQWAMLPDSALPIDISLSLLDGVHARWSTLCASVRDADFTRPFQHPDLGQLTIDTHLQIYGWHSRHHVAHITALRTREGW
jgi:hypothetical protein